MAGEINYFRKRFLGGFDKQDVADYIAGQAKELKKLRDEFEVSKQERERLLAEIEALKIKFDEEQHAQVNALEEMKKTHEVHIDEEKKAHEEKLSELHQTYVTKSDQIKAEYEELNENTRRECEEKLAKARTEREEADAAHAHMLESLRFECEEIKKQAHEYKVAALESAGVVLEELRTSLNGYQTVLDEATSRAQDELKLAADSLAALPLVIERTEETVISLIGQINEEKDGNRFNVSLEC